MKVNHYERVPAEAVRMEGAVGCRVRWLIGTADNAPNFAMRQFEVAPGGHTPRHCHPYEHEVFVLEGEGIVSECDAEHRLRAGDVVYVKPDEIHQFRNVGSKPLKFLCLIPNSGNTPSASVAPECGCEPARPSGASGSR
jgi:quercetin dioxygenase-like cupin family protein